MNRLSSPQSRRYFIGVATASWPHATGFQERPELLVELARMRELFVRTFGYEEVSGFGADVTSSDFREGLGRFLRDPDRRPDDHVVVYYTGHADIETGQLLLPFADATEDLARSAVPAAELARWVMTGTAVQRVAIVLDTCHAADIAESTASRAAERLGAARGEAAASIVLAVASRPHESAESGAFTHAFERAANSPSTAGVEPEFLQFEAIVGVINADDRTLGWQHAAHFSFGEASASFLPNPRHRAELDVRERIALTAHQEELRDGDLRSHFQPRARGLDAPGIDVWLFTGRHAILRSLSAWLSDSDSSSRIVTGSPGSGKSSVIARLGILASPLHRPLVPRIDELPDDTVPPRGPIDVMIHARRRSAAEILEALTVASGQMAGDPPEWVARMAERGRPFVAAIDAVDESTEPLHVARTLLRPVLQAKGSGVRLLIGTRKTVLPALAEAPVLDLDDDTYADPDAVRRYTERCLRQLVPDSPYAELPDAFVGDVAAAVAEAAGRSFLVALIYSRSLASRRALVDPHDPAWRSGLPREASAAMRQDLAERLGRGAHRAEVLLRALAYARGAGLPWEDVWALVASRIAGEAYTNDDLLWLREQAGFYVVEDLEDDRSAYRLYHQALADHLTDGRDVSDDERRVVEVLADLVPAAGGQRDFTRAHPYTKANLASHAAAASSMICYSTPPFYLPATADGSWRHCPRRGSATPCWLRTPFSARCIIS